MLTDQTSPLLHRAPTVCDMIGVKSREQLDNLINDGEFPKPIKIGKRAVAWLDSEIRQWLERRIAERDGRVADAANTENPLDAPMLAAHQGAEGAPA